MDAARHALTVLTRLAERRPEEVPKLERALAGRLEQLSLVALNVAIETGDPMGGALERALRAANDIRQAERLVEHIPRDTTALREAAVTVVELARNSATGSARYTLSLSLAERLGDAGHRDRALQVAEETRSEILADSAIANDRSIVARAHNVYAASLRDVGRLSDALAAASISTALRRELASTQELRSDLATSLVELASIHKELGNRRDAADTATEAVQLYEVLAQDDRRFLPRLAGAQSNLATFLVDLDLPERAVEVQRQALEQYQSLAERNPDAYLPYVAIAENNLANDLSLLRRFDEALSLVEHAVQGFRELAARRPDIYGEYLAVGLNSLSNRLNDLSRTDDAITAAKESVSSMKGFAQRYEQAFTPLVARSLHTLAYRLFDANRLQEAGATAEEAIEIRRKLAARNERAAGVSLALSLGVRAAIYSKSDQLALAADAITESLTLLVRMATEYFGKAVAREAKEIGGRYLRFIAAASRQPDEQLIAAVKDTCGVETLGPIS